MHQFASLQEIPDPYSPPIARPRQGMGFTVVGQQRNCRWLQVVTDDGQQGWVNAEAGAVQWDGNCAEIPLGTFRPRSGVIVDTFPKAGLGELKIENGVGDVVVVLATPDRSMQQVVYVRSGETITTDNIPDGVFDLFYVSGLDWDGQQFTQMQTRQKFSDTFPYETTRSSSTIWTVTLHPVIDGNARVLPVDGDEFPPIAVE